MRTASHFFVVRDFKDVDIEELRISSLTLPDDILDPAKEPVHSDIYRFTQTEDGGLAELAEDFYEKRVWLLILGYIEYETMGTKWHRDFGFVRESSKGGLWSMLGNPAPDSPEEKLVRGYWNSRSRYPNEEHEMKQEVD